MSVKRYDVMSYSLDVDGNSGPFVKHEEYAALEARCAALAAELSAFERICNEAVFITDEHYEQCPPEVQKMIRFLVVLKIPSYQAFMAEVRAQGVEMLRDSIAEIEGGIEDTIDLHHYCSDFAAEVRKGAQS
ncbi:hypothetical protein [Enterobacter sp. JMULE2]|uniref:hypothetical protein n=1 Tax=Enterobacter sp. JMULE2 TaxID=2518340 RepID=UPI00205F6C5B|nr:hypothetical protein [Enterobacter sp. JMULE2]DAF33695.1 MAG TPA: hypothetical protein [Caudoviricetes sp.]